jgi:HKD family nuclease
MVKPGIYEQVVNKDLKNAISEEPNLLSFTGAIDDAEAPKVLSNYLAMVVERGLTTAGFDGDINEQVRFVNELIGNIVRITGEDAITGLSVDPRAEQLLALISKKNSSYLLNEKLEIPRPETSISRSSLFTGALHEPSMMTELKKEITSSDRIDMLVSFIKWSGLRLIMDELMEFTQRGGHLRVVATSYMGATDVKAIECLSRLSNTEIKISYDTKRTRLHAKAYVFFRESGFSTAYIGSSNLSHAAISSGLEWNVKITEQDMQDTMRKVRATFDSYWNSPEFELFGEGDTERLRRALKAERMRDSRSSPMMFDIHPYPFQQEILDKLAAERTIRNHFN